MVWSWGCLVEYTTTVASSAAVGFVVPLPFTAPRWAPVGSNSCSATMQSSGQSVVWDLRLPTAPTDLEHDPSLRGRASQHGLAIHRSATQASSFAEGIRVYGNAELYTADVRAVRLVCSGAAPKVLWT